MSPHGDAPALPVPESSAARRRAVLLWGAFALAASLVGGRTLRNLNEPGRPTLPRYGMQDFRDAIYYPAVALLDGNNPYDVSLYRETYPVVCKFPLYAPSALAIHLPFGLLSPVHAARAFLVVNILLMLVLAAVTLRVAGLPVREAAVTGLATVLLLSHPGQMIAFLGQSTIYLVIGIYLALGFARSRPWLAAAGLALASVKPTFGLPVAFLMLWRGDFGVVLRGGVIAAVVSMTVGAFLVRDAGGVGPLIASLWDNYHQWDRSQFINISEAVHRVDAFVVAGRLAGQQLSASGDLLLTFAIFGLATWCVVRLARHESEAGRAVSTSLICATTLVGAYHQAYDALVLALPAVMLVRGTPFAAAGSFGRRARWALLALLGVLAANYLSTYAVIERLGLRGAWWLTVTSVNGVAVLGTFLLLTALGLRLTGLGEPVVHPGVSASTAGSRIRGI